MSRLGDGTNYLLADFGASWFSTHSDVQLTCWVNDNGTGWANFDNWCAVGGGETPFDGSSMAIDQKNTPSIRADINTAGNDEQIEVAGTMNSSTWYLLYARCRLGHDGSTTVPVAHEAGIYPVNGSNNENAIGNWTGGGETSIRHVSILSGLEGNATMGGGLISGVAIWEGYLSTSDMSSLYNKTHPLALSPSNATLKGYFLDEHAHSSGTEEYADQVGGSVTLTAVGTDPAYSSEEPGVDAPPSTGGASVWAPNTGIITDGSGFRGFIR